jgi:uncharacterized membrane protein
LTTKKLLFYWNEITSTFWFLPVLIIMFSVALALGLVSLDNSITVSHEGWVRFFLVNSADSARSILSTISGGMIGVAGTVFSVTLVALTLASSQLGPRLIKNFMYVRLNQVVLGSYVSTYLYCLLVLNAIRDNDGYSFIPSISVLVALVATVVNIILLIVFIHQIAVSIQADRVISDISDFIAKQVETLFPEKMGDGDDENGMDEAAELSAYSNRIPIRSKHSGYLQYIDHDVLMEEVVKQESLLKIHPRPGGFIVDGSDIGMLYSNAEVNEESLKKLRSQFVIGKTKTPQQDLEYSIHQMVEIAVRALSPGVNDPYTAIACIDHLSATMCYLAQAKFPPTHRIDENGQLRVVANNVEFEGVMDAAFNQIRQFSGGSPAVMIRLMDAMNTIRSFATKEHHKKAVRKHTDMVLALGEETITEPNDLNDLKERNF